MMNLFQTRTLKCLLEHLGKFFETGLLGECYTCDIGWLESFSFSEYLCYLIPNKELVAIGTGTKLIGVMYHAQVAVKPQPIEQGNEQPESVIVAVMVRPSKCDPQLFGGQKAR